MGYHRAETGPRRKDVPRVNDTVNLRRVYAVTLIVLMVIGIVVRVLLFQPSCTLFARARAATCGLEVPVFPTRTAGQLASIRPWISEVRVYTGHVLAPLNHSSFHAGNRTIDACRHIINSQLAAPRHIPHPRSIDLASNNRGPASGNVDW